MLCCDLLISYQEGDITTVFKEYVGGGDCVSGGESAG